MSAYSCLRFLSLLELTNVVVVICMFIDKNTPWLYKNQFKSTQRHFSAGEMNKTKGNKVGEEPGTQAL